VGFKKGYGDLMGFKGLNGIEWLPPSCKHTKRNQKMFPWEKHLHMVLFSMKNTAKRTRICLMFFRGKYGKTQILMVYHHFLKQIVSDTPMWDVSPSSRRFHLIQHIVQ